MQLALKSIKLMQLYWQIEQVYIKYMYTIICHHCHQLNYSYNCYRISKLEKKNKEKEKTKDELVCVVICFEFDNQQWLCWHLIAVHRRQLFGVQMCWIYVCCNENNCMWSASQLQLLWLLLMHAKKWTCATSFLSKLKWIIYE